MEEKNNREIIREERKKIFAKNLKSTHFVTGKFLASCIDIYPRLKCQNCGLYGRAILCPPLLSQTYRQFQTIDSSKEWYKKHISTAAIFVFKNDGTKPWKRKRRELAHIEFKKRFGRQLKGVENGSAKEINRQMYKFQTRMKSKYDREAMSLICGHCDICPGSHRCPNRENPPCKRHGMTSLEATGLDVYKILEELDIKYEYPVLTQLTQVTALLVLKNKK